MSMLQGAEASELAMQHRLSSELASQNRTLQPSRTAAAPARSVSRLLKVLLLVAGLIAVAIGSAILFATDAFYAEYGLALGNNISLMSELRAPAGALVASGALMATGAFVSRLTFTSGLTATLLYLSYGGGRLLSMAMDGLPDRGLVQATFFEVVFGVALACAMVREYPHTKNPR